MRALPALLAAAAVALSACSAGERPAASGAASPSSLPSSSAQAPAGLLGPANAYVQAVNGGNLDALVAAFAPDAVIIDVSREIRGRDAIRTWADREVIGGRLTVNRIVENRGGYQKLLVHWAPGGSGGWAAHYAFTVNGSGITRADLQYA
ncbi:hypothetical protein GCM10009678_71600 [Actinomadura kijaniata]|uniref:SnoaL-like domain-containing protein n=1 Tax=Actinomadura namibiensis TaxID=182080 RepID=A0A7W3LS29_ACTNM|nr:nuclear transport factor 2 family protein [Actinomadura namibiensis]MBA8953243.1 hypothetical protein [Actinomadura namibiensis]